MTLGSASFEFIGRNESLVVAGAQAEAAAKKNYQAIADAAGVSATSVERSANRYIAARRSEAEDSAASALKVIRSYNDEADAAEKAAKKQVEASKGTALEYVKMGAALAGVQASAEGAKAALEGVLDATLKQQQAQFAVNKLYGESSALVTKNAEDLAAASGRSKTEALEAAASVATLGRNYALTGEQIQKVLAISADLAAVRGISLDAAAERTQSALRGEAEAIEYLGQALNSNALKAFADMDAAQRKNFESLSEVTKADIVYNALVKNTADLQGTAAERTETSAGKIDKLKASGENLAASVGQTFLPVIGEMAGALGKVGETAAQATDALNKMPQARDGIAALGVAIALGLVNPLNVAAVAAVYAYGKIAQAIDVAKNGPVLGPEAPADIGKIQAEAADREKDAANEAKKAQAREADRQKQIAATRKEARALESEANIRALDEEQRQNDAAYQVSKTRIEAERETKLRSLDVQKKAAIDAIHDEAKVAKDASEEKIRQYQVEEAAAKQKASDEHDEAVKGIDAEVQATGNAVDENIRNLEIERDHAKQASEDKRDAAIKGLDDEKRARDAARVTEDRALQDDVEKVKRREDARHQATTREFDDETKAANTKKDRDLKDIADVEQRDQKRHDTRVQRFKDELDFDQKLHGAAAARIEGETKAAQAAYDTEDARLKSVSEAAQQERDRLTKGYDEQLSKALAVNKTELADIQAKGEADQTVHEHALAQIQTEADEAQRARDSAVRGVEQQQRAEDDRHRVAMSAIDAEQQRRQQALDAEIRGRQGAIDAQIRGLDDLDKAQQNASTIQGLTDRVATAKTGVEAARWTGNQSTMDEANRALLAAEQALADGQTKIQRDAQRQQLQDQKSALGEEASTRKSALADEIAAEKDAENERSRLRSQELADNKQAADDELKRVQTILAARRDEADQTLKQVQAVLEGRTKAAAAALELVQTQTAAGKTAADEELTRVQASVKAGQEANTARLKATQERLAKERTDADETLRLAKDRIDQEIKAEDAKLVSVKDKLDKRKIAVADANRDELEGIATRKRAEQDAHDDAVTKAADQTKQLQRQVQDRRTSEDLADQAHRKQAQDQYDADQRLLHARYDAEDTGEIPRLHRALDAFKETAGQRKTEADTLYQNEQRQIQATYSDEQTGLIPMQRRAEADAADKFGKMAASAEASFQSQRQNIQDTYSNAGKTGLLDQLDAAKKKTEDTLKDQRQFWQDWKDDLAGPSGKIATVIGQFDELIKKATAANVAAQTAAAVRPGTGGGGGSGGGPNAYGNQAAGRTALIGGLQVPLGTVPGSVAPEVQYQSLPDDQVADFIRAAFVQVGGMPAASDAIDVWSGEGRRGYVGDFGTSFGPFQLHINGGIGDDFERDTGKDLRDPNTWPEQINWVAGYVKQHGWNNRWHGAPGYPNGGISNKTYADGTVINRPTRLTDVATGAVLGMAGENYRPERLLGERDTAALDARLNMPAPITAPTGSFSLPTSIAVPAARSYGAPGTPEYVGPAGAGTLEAHYHFDFRNSTSYDGVSFEKIVTRALRQSTERGTTLSDLGFNR